MDEINVDEDDKEARAVLSSEGQEVVEDNQATHEMDDRMLVVEGSPQRPARHRRHQQSHLAYVGLLAAGIASMRLAHGREI